MIITGYYNDYVEVNARESNCKLYKQIGQQQALYMLSTNCRGADDRLVDQPHLYIHRLVQQPSVFQQTDNYRLGECIGRGSFSDVYSAIGKHGESVAIRLPREFNKVNATHRSNLLQELKNRIRELDQAIHEGALEALNYEALTSLLYELEKQRYLELAKEGIPSGILTPIGNIDNDKGFVYPLGGSDWINSISLSLNHLIEGFLRLANTLNCLHSLGLYHNDVKLNNIVNGPEGIAFIDCSFSQTVRGVNKFYRVDDSIGQCAKTEILALGYVFYVCCVFRLTDKNKYGFAERGNTDSMMSSRQLILLKNGLLSMSHKMEHRQSCLKLFSLIRMMICSSKEKRLTTQELTTALLGLQQEIKD